MSIPFGKMSFKRIGHTLHLIYHTMGQWITKLNHLSIFILCSILRNIFHSLQTAAIMREKELLNNKEEVSYE